MGFHDVKGAMSLHICNVTVKKFGQSHSKCFVKMKFKHAGTIWNFNE